MMNFFERLKPSNLPESVIQKGTVAVHREIILQWAYNILITILTLVMPLIFIFLPDVVRPSVRVATTACYVVLFSLTYFRGINYNARAAVLILFLQFIGSLAIYANSLINFGWMFLFASVALANLMLGHRYGIIFFLLSAATVAMLGILIINGMLIPNHLPDPTNLNFWIVSGIIFLFTVSLVVSAAFIVIRNMENTLKAQARLTRELEEEQDLLEQRVEERSNALKNRVAQFEVASQVAREISGEMNLDGLLNTAANLIRDQFGFYHVGVFLNDAQNEYAVLRAATGEAGRQMMERAHRLKIGEIGLVGYTAGRGEARLALNVGNDSQHFKNPLLPQTRSEVALPLRIADRTIGALDVQSMVENAFSQDDIRILQTIADQLAIAVQKTQLVEKLQQTVKELEASYQATTRKAWHEHMRNARQKLAYRFAGSQIENAVVETEHAQEALTQGKSILTTTRLDEHNQPITVLAVPIKLRNQVLGVVDIHFASASVSPDLITLIEGTVNRLAVSLENARLLEEIQFRAERERLVGEISSKVRAASDVDTVMRVAIEELGKSLGVSEVMVQLRKEA